MTNTQDHTLRSAHATTAARRQHAVPRGFTLIELMVVVALIALLTSLATFSFKTATQQSARSLAVNTITSYLGVVRAYAIENRIETMMVVNPYDGRLEVWRANPPVGQQRNPPWSITPGNNHPDDMDGNNGNGWQFPDGGSWDVRSNGRTAGGGGSSIERANANGYAFVPLLDSTARIPVDGNGVPIILISPIDFEVRRRNADVGFRLGDQMPFGGTDALYYTNNLIWTAFCFDANGKLVQRARRIDMNQRGVPGVNKEYQPRVGLNSYSVSADSVMTAGSAIRYDTLLMSTTGFVASDRPDFEAFAGQPLQQLFSDPATVANADGILSNWLISTLPGTVTGETIDTARSAQHILLNPYTGRPMQKGL